MSKKLQITPSRPIITASEINKHLSDPDNIHWVLMDQLMDDTPEQCVDGRSSTGIIGTPGGNMGEFILALHAAELVTNKTTTNTQVSHIFKNYLLRFNAFYMHTDTHALDHLKEELNKNNLFKNIPTKTTKDIEKLIRKPNPSIQSTLLEYLINPANIGCGHIKLMLSHPDEYSVRPKLIRSAIKAYFQALWEDTKLDYTVLAADHAEAAVLTVLIEDKKITTKTMVPTVVSMGKNHQMFISHPQVEGFMRKLVAQDIAKRKLIEGISEQNQEKYLETIQTRGADLTRHTLSHLAMGLPHYTVTLKQP